MNFKLVLSKTSPQAYTQSELNMFGVPKNLENYVVH